MPLAAIALLSAGIIAYEIVLMRLFAVIQWHHFAFMIISIALLGYGVSGTVLAFARVWLLARFRLAWQVHAALFAIGAPLAFALAQRLPLNPLEILWAPRQVIYLAATGLVLMVPFLCGANAIGLALARFGGGIGRVYRSDLIGAGAGASVAIMALFVLPPGDCLRLIAGLGLAATAAASIRWRSGLALAVAALAVPLLIPPSLITPRPSDYKGLTQALRAPGATVVHESWSPLGLLSVVDSPTIPFRHAPGLSLASTAIPPAQLGLFTDAGAMAAITRFDGDLETVRYLDFTTPALPYHVLDRPEVLILGAGAGADVLLARYHRAARIDAVEADPAVIALIRDRFAAYAGHIYDHDRTRIHVADGRNFVARAETRWDLIHLPILGAAAGAGLGETTLYTVEAFRDMLDRLRPGGMIAATRWLRLPPRESLKLVATAIAALGGAGVTDPGRRLALIRNWRTTTLLIKNGDLTADQIARIEAFAEARSFDLAYLPGLARERANRHNLLDAPFVFDGVGALLGPARDDFLDRYKFDLTPARDDRPYFFDFLKWRTVPELAALRVQAAPLIERGPLILAATLLQAVVLSVGLILLPLWAKGGPGPGRAPPRSRIGAYFLCLGLAFLFVEIAFIRHLVLFLGHPIFAVAVVLAAFLLFAGLGAGAAPGIAKFVERRGLAPVPLAAVAAGVAALVILTVLPWLSQGLIAAPMAVRILVALAVIAPLAFPMGMPFPLGLAPVAASTPTLVPWALGMNGCASVIAAVLATL
ncbi:MAG: SAM-dependent methyltransferase, partial [Alphaproteobacteria bacterium]|nr:SAM-dependent methyltransferase [Alphaproteobacteria bacterium]